jgi:hypothetical protein
LVGWLFLFCFRLVYGGKTWFWGGFGGKKGFFEPRSVSPVTGETALPAGERSLMQGEGFFAGRDASPAASAVFFEAGECVVGASEGSVAAGDTTLIASAVSPGPSEAPLGSRAASPVALAPAPGASEAAPLVKRDSPGITWTSPAAGERPLGKTRGADGKRESGFDEPCLTSQPLPQSIVPTQTIARADYLNNAPFKPQTQVPRQMKFPKQARK